MMPWSRCNCSSRRESGRAITVTLWPARASWYANVLPILPAPMTAIDKGGLAAGAIFFMTTSPLIRFPPVRGWLSVDDVADPVQAVWAGDGPAQTLHDGYGCTGLLLRSAKSLAARLERKYQSAVATILLPRHRPVYVFASAARSCCATPE